MKMTHGSSEAVKELSVSWQGWQDGVGWGAVDISGYQRISPLVIQAK